MAHAPDDYALVIGINDYPQWGAKGRSLKGAVRDAEAMAAWLRDPGRGGLIHDHVRLITSTLDPLTPLQPQIDDELDWIKRALGEDGKRRRFYFYFSGHGHIRIGGDNDMPSLCLPNWSTDRAGAALSLQSYVNATVGCFGFEEGVFFLDCCRVQQVAPAGRTSDLDCGMHDMAGRASSWAFAAEPTKAGYEGLVDGEMRGYFTSTLLQILDEAPPICLLDVQKALVARLPAASGNRQTPRFGGDIGGDKLTSIFFGPPRGGPGGDRRPRHVAPREPPPVGPLYPLHVELKTNLDPNIRYNEPPAPPPGEITIFDDAMRQVAFGYGALGVQLPRGTFLVRIRHGDALEDHPIEHPGLTPRVFDLPRRRSAALLSSTTDKHEWNSGAASAASTYAPAPGEQSIFLFVRTPEGYLLRNWKGSLRLDGKPVQFGDLGARLIGAPAGVHQLEHKAGRISRVLPVPVASGWDTQVFIVVEADRPVLERASVMMREAGLGFDPRDALLDAYERALLELASGGPGPEGHTLENLLWGKYRNPLYGLVGAHFLLRSLTRTPGSQEDWHRLQVVINNLADLLGEDSPDVWALRVMAGDIRGEAYDGPAPGQPPLLASAADGVLRASISAPWITSGIAERGDMAFNREPDSPWNCWGSDAFRPRAWVRQQAGITTFHLTGLSLQLEAVAREVLQEAGLRVSRPVPPSRSAPPLEPRLVASADHRFEDYRLPGLLSHLEDIAATPDWLIEYCAAEAARPARDAPATAEEIARRLAIPSTYVEIARRAAEPPREEPRPLLRSM